MGKHTKKPISLRMTEDEAALLDRMAAKHGGKSAAIVQGLKRLEGSNDLTDAELILTLKQRLERTTEKKDRDIDRDNPKTDPHQILSSPNRIVTPPNKRNQ